MSVLTNPQRMLLALIDSANRPPDLMRLQLESFVLTRQSQQIGLNYHHFFPYHNTPYSALLERGLNKLVTQGLVAGSPQCRILDLPRCRSEIATLPSVVQENAVLISRRFAPLTEQQLREHISTRFADFAAIGEQAEAVIFSIGYEGMDLDSFLDSMLHAGVETLIDVRENPNSRVWGFARKTLSGWCGKVEIDYRHFPELGVPAALRKNVVSTEDHQSLLRHYGEDILPEKAASFAALKELVRVSPCALMCREQDPSLCHRTILAAALAQAIGFRVENLRSDR